MGQYDDAVKALCLQLPASVCRLVGAPASGSAETIRHSETLSTATRQIDALISIDGRVAHHIEFQANGEPRFDLRMLDYRLRLYRLPNLAGKQITQHVVMLGPGTIEHQLHDDQLDYAFAVHYLRDAPVAPLLADVGLAPFAVLANHPDDGHRARALRAALDLFAEVSDKQTREVLVQAATDLAALRLDEATINSTWEDSAMPIPSLIQRKYDEGVHEGVEQGIEQGIQQGIQLGRERLLASFLRQRFGQDARIPVIAKRLAAIDSDDWLARINAAAALEEFAEPDD
jgi:hypothetical protein